MKSRVINVKHLTKTSDGYTGYTSKLRPSLWYGNPKIEGEIHIQHSDNTMTKWEIGVIVESPTLTWVFYPTEKSIKKRPNVEGKSITIIFDLYQNSKMAKKVRAK